MLFRSTNYEIRFLLCIIYDLCIKTPFLKEEIKKDPSKELWEYISAVAPQVFAATGISIKAESNGVFVFPPEITRYTGDLSNWDGVEIIED